MLRKRIIALLAVASVGLAAPTMALARGGGGGGGGGGGSRANRLRKQHFDRGRYRSALIVNHLWSISDHENASLLFPCQS